MSRKTAILPGSTIGVLGSGQLGRMFTLAARRLGYRVHTFSPETDTPTGQVADQEITAAYDDLPAVAQFAKDVRVVTFEFENVPTETAETAARHAPVRPGGNVLHTTQERLREKTFLKTNGFPVTPFAAIASEADFHAAAVEIGLPGVLKTAAFGYDGKGQAKIATLADGLGVIASSPGTQWIYEKLVDFEREISVVAARGLDGAFAHFGVVENRHHHHILDISICPAQTPSGLANEAVQIAAGVLEKLDVVGVLCVEFFVTKSGKLLVNELAPRPHNSGHFTIDACVTSQFEQQLRAVCGLPLGETRQFKPSAMANLLGDIWADGEPNWPAALAMPGVHLHLYGKAEPRAGRKMGHLTALGETAGDAAERVMAAREALLRR